MAMRIRLTVIVCFLSFRILGQEIKEKHLLRGVDDNEPYSVTIQEDVVNEITTLSIGVNTVTISGVQDIKTVTLHSEVFLEVQFRIRGGSGIKVRRAVLLCVSQGKIYKALDVLSEVTSRVSEVYDKVADSLKLFDEKEDYQIMISIKHAEGKLYSAILSERIRIESKYNPTQNLSHDKPYELQFDPGGFFFYNSTKRLNRHYQIYSSRNNKTVDKFVSEEVPCIQLYDKRYLLIDHEWCLDNGNDSLTCL
jgi:hypothetical protein